MRNGEWSILYNATPSVDSFFVIGAILLAYLSTETIIAKFNTPINFLSSYALSNGFECDCCVSIYFEQYKNETKIFIQLKS